MSRDRKPPLGAAARQAQGRLAIAMRNHPGDVASITELRREFAALRLEDYIAETLAAYPPPNAQQAERLVRLLVEANR